jgi:hypothetical protein
LRGGYLNAPPGAFYGNETRHASAAEKKLSLSEEKAPPYNEKAAPRKC